MGFFSEYEDTKSANLFAVIIGIGFLLASIFGSVFFKIESNLLTYLAISSIAIALFFGLEGLKIGGNKLIATVGFKNKNMAILGYLAGIGVGLVLTTGKSFSLLAIDPVFQQTFPFSVAIMAVFVAPVIEPLFWRGIIAPTFALWTEKIFGTGLVKRMVGIILASALFAFAHTAVLVSSQTQPSADLISNFIFVAFIYGIIFTVGNYMLGIAFEIGWHFVNNVFASGLEGITAYSTIGIYGLIFLVVMAIIVGNEKQ